MVYTHGMSTPRYRKSAGCVYSLQYHLVWCPKYRKKVLVGQIADDLKILLAEKAQALSAEIVAVEVMPDHVHMFISTLPTEAPQHFVNQFKGYTSRILRQRYPTLRTRLPSLWSRSYFISTAGHVAAETIQRYIAEQKERG